MNIGRRFHYVFAAAILLTASCAGEGRADTFEGRIYRNVRGEAMPYRLYVPANYDKRKKYPLILWLHGGGGRGSDNQKQLTEGNSAGATVWTKPENQSKHPSFVVAPQCPENKMWTSIRPTVEPTDQLRLVMELLRELRRAYSIDDERIYVAGQSMGGYGTWALISEYPKMFAAAVPICGGGNESDAARLVDVPIWAFHGELDRAVKVERSRNMIAAIRRAGGKPRYTEYEGADHVVWNMAFNEPELLPWVFAQRLSSEGDK